MNIKKIMLAAAVLATTIGPVFADVAPYCVAVNGGFDGNGGTSFVARNFDFPEASKCTPWAGYTKTSATVIFTTNGTACASDDGTVLTLSVTSQDPAYLGVGTSVSDYLQVCTDVNNCPIGGGSDVGYLTGSAAPQDCSDYLLDLPTFHD
jgi:hypothetical protein